MQWKTCCFRSRQSWIWNAERILRKDKGVVLSRDQANMTLVFVHSCNSCLGLCHYVPALLEQHHVVLRVVWILWNDYIRTPKMSPHNQLFYQISIFGSFHIKQSSVPSETWLKLGFCEHYSYQMTYLSTNTIRKCSIEKEHSFWQSLFHLWRAISSSTKQRLKSMSM